MYYDRVFETEYLLKRQIYKMEKRKRTVKEIVFEIFLELILTLVFLGIGALVLILFGADFNFLEIDPELVTLIGFGAVLVLFVLVYIIVRLVKKVKANKE